MAEQHNEKIKTEIHLFRQQLPIWIMFREVIKSTRHRAAMRQHIGYVDINVEYIILCFINVIYIAEYHTRSRGPSAQKILSPVPHATEYQ